jgi:hypothetical protein
LSGQLSDILLHVGGISLEVLIADSCFKSLPCLSDLGLGCLCISLHLENGVIVSVQGLLNIFSSLLIITSKLYLLMVDRVGEFKLMNFSPGLINRVLLSLDFKSVSLSLDLLVSVLSGLSVLLQSPDSLS